MPRIAAIMALVICFAPAMVSAQSVGLFTVYGDVESLSGWRVQVENEMVASSLQSALLSEFTPETYAFVFTDFDTNRAAALGDQFRVVLFDANNLALKINFVVITQADLDAFGARVDLCTTIELCPPVSVESNTWTAIRELYR